jgi:hypothetical protein
MKRGALLCLSFLLVAALTLDASAFRGGGGRGGGGGFQGGGGGVLSGRWRCWRYPRTGWRGRNSRADGWRRRCGPARGCRGKRTDGWWSVRAGVPQCADRWAAASLRAQGAMLPCVGLRETSPSAVADHIQTFMAAPTLIMAGVLPPQVLRRRCCWLLVPRQPPHTTTPTTRSPTTNLPAGRPTRPRTRRAVIIPTKFPANGC